VWGPRSRTSSLRGKNSASPEPMSHSGGTERQSLQFGFSSKKVRILTKRHRQMSKKIIINNLAVNYYERAGADGAPTLLFLHGWRSAGAVWQKLTEKLPNYNIYAPDFPGFGQSEAPKKNFTVGDYAGLVDGFIKKLGLNKVNIIGHSFGGRVAIKLAAKNPFYLDKLILADSAGVRQFSFSLMLKKIVAKTVSPIFQLKITQGARRIIYQKLSADDYLAAPDRRQTFLNIINEDLTPLLGKIKAPTLLIWGGDDKETPLNQARVMERSVPGSKLVVLKNAGHYGFLDQPEEFVKNLIDFINEK